jgi:hypothetical protein
MGDSIVSPAVCDGCDLKTNGIAADVDDCEIIRH